MLSLEYTSTPSIIICNSRNSLELRFLFSVILANNSFIISFRDFLDNSL